VQKSNTQNSKKKKNYIERRVRLQSQAVSKMINHNPDILQSSRWCPVFDHSVSTNTQLEVEWLVRTIRNRVYFKYCTLHKLCDLRDHRLAASLVISVMSMRLASACMTQIKIGWLIKRTNNRQHLSQ